MSGGEYHAFTGDKAFEARVVESAQHAHNRYLITFSPRTRRRDCIRFACGRWRITARGLWRGRIIGGKRNSEVQLSAISF